MPKVTEVFERILETAMPNLMQMVEASGLTLDQAFAIVVGADDDIMCMVCDIEKRNEFADALPNQPDFGEHLRHVADVGANGLLRVVMAIGHGDDIAFGRIRIQLHEGGAS